MLSKHLTSWTTLLGASSGGSFWFPEQASVTAASTDWLFNFILWISVFFMALIVGLMLTFMWSYRRRPGVEAERTTTHHTPLELLWTIIPTILCVIIFYFGISGYVDLRTPPQNAREVQVTGQKWIWNFTYPGGMTHPELHVVANEPTRLVMRSEDVIHSLYIPAFRVKMDVVPGRYSKLWFTPTETGEHHLFCAEYCGLNHSGMITKVVVHTAEDYEEWLRKVDEEAAKADPVELGSKVYHTRGCAACHSIDGSKLIGPTFKGAYGREESLTDGTKITVDEDYIHESIIDPQAKIVAGYAPVMPSFKGKLKDAEIHGVVEFIKSLK